MALALHSPVPKGTTPDKTLHAAQTYRNLHREESGGSLAARKSQYMTMVNNYYDLVTDFYEYGWGQSFHFAPRRQGESFAESLKRHERYLGQQLGLQPGMKVLDIGCGVGGPMREIARATGAKITGVNNNAYQLEKCAKYNARAGLDGLCDTLQTDFMKLPLPANSVDAIYAIEATCHAPDKTALFRELYRVVKPGGGFAGYEWCLTDDFDVGDPRHQKIKKGIEEGDALPDIAPTHGVVESLNAAGFDVVVARDVALDADPGYPWFRALQGLDLSISSFPRTPIGGFVTYHAVGVLEKFGVAPKGTKEVSSFLRVAAEHLVAGGKLGIFTPCFYFNARKPQRKPRARAKS